MVIPDLKPEPYTYMATRKTTTKKTAAKRAPVKPAEPVNPKEPRPPKTALAQYEAMQAAVSKVQTQLNKECAALSAAMQPIAQEWAARLDEIAEMREELGLLGDNYDAQAALLTTQGELSALQAEMDAKRQEWEREQAEFNYTVESARAQAEAEAKFAFDERRREELSKLADEKRAHVEELRDADAERARKAKELAARIAEVDAREEAVDAQLENAVKAAYEQAAASVTKSFETRLTEANNALTSVKLKLEHAETRVEDQAREITKLNERIAELLRQQAVFTTTALEAGAAANAAYRNGVSTGTSTKS